MSRLLDGTKCKISTSNKKFKSFKSTYKNASSMSFDHASAGDPANVRNTLTRPARNWAKDREVYHGSDILNTSTFEA